MSKTNSNTVETISKCKAVYDETDSLFHAFSEDFYGIVKDSSGDVWLDLENIVMVGLASGQLDIVDHVLVGIDPNYLLEQRDKIITFLQSL